ncbi:MAG: amidohydrolase [Planctomycetes bacterium]|nr:amidohydrolase [Planctomycetota bacterium]
MKDQWSGTMMFVGQPAEEIGTGSRLMLEDGLYKKFPTPNYALAMHVSHEMKVGTVGYTSGWALANVDSVDITVHGKGGHGAYPHQTVDPIVTASQIVLAPQTIVSRRLDPRDTAVVTVGSIHGGTKHNVIPDSVTLQLTVRSYTDEVRKSLLDSIRQIATDICKAANCPKPPDVRVIENEFTPATYNEPQLVSQCVDLFGELLGAENVIARKPSMGGEDFSRYSRDAKGVKGFIYWIGVVDEARFAAAQEPGAEPLPSIHSAKFRPDPEPTIRTGVRTMCSAALSLLQKN